MAVLSIYLRNTIFFLLLLMWTGTFDVIPQIFFMRNYPENKTTFLIYFLMFGGIFSICGIYASQKQRFERRLIAGREKALTLVFFVMTTITFLSLFLVKALFVYFLAYIVFNFVSHFLFDHLDHSYVQRTSFETMNIYIRSNVTFQLFGAMIAPFYFSIFYSNTLAHLLLISILSLISGTFALTSFKSDDASSTREMEEPTAQTKLNMTDWLFLLYSSSISSGVFIFSSMTIYILKDYYLLDDAAIGGGLLIGVISIVAVISVLVVSSLRKPIQKSRDSEEYMLELLSPHLNFLSLLLLFTAGTLFYLKLSISLFYLFSFGAVAGCGFGLFTALTRDYASKISLSFHKFDLLSIYNTLPNYAILIGLSISLLVSWSSRYFLFDFFAILICVILAIFLVALCFFIALITRLGFFNFRKVTDLD